MQGHFCAFHWQKWNRSGNDAGESFSERTSSSFLMWLDLESAARKLLKLRLDCGITVFPRLNVSWATNSLAL